MAANFANVDFTDRTAVERLLEDASREATQAWSDAAKAAEALQNTTEAVPANAAEEAVKAFGSLTARATEANLNLLKSQAQMVTDILQAATEAYRRFAEAAKQQKAPNADFGRLYEEIAKLEEANAALGRRSGSVDTTTPPHKRRVA